MVVLPLLDDGAGVLTVDPEFVEEFDELEDELEVAADDDVVALDAVLEVRPAYVCSASTPRPATPTTALVTVERSTRVRSRSARSRRMTADVCGELCDTCCEGLPFMRSRMRPRHGILMRATWEAAGKRRTRSAGSGAVAQVQRKRGTRRCGPPREREQTVRHHARSNDRIAPLVEHDQLRQQLRTGAMTCARDAIDHKALLGHLSSPPQAAPRRGSRVWLHVSRNRVRTP